MPQFDAFPHPVPSMRKNFPLAVNLRSDLIAAGATALIAPLVPRSKFPGASGRLSPLVQIDGEVYVVLVEHLVTLPSRKLPDRIANLARHREALLGAVDLLFYGV
jgi:toxin CcdB